jgi:hypothetical protein
MYRAHKHIKFDAAKWHRQIVNPLLVECHNLWLLRNDERHGKEQSQKRTRRLEQLERDLIAIFQFESEVLASDRDIFDTPISDLLTLPPSEITKWIASRKPIILQSRRAARRSSTHITRLLPTYFHPLRKSSRKQRKHRHRKLRPMDLIPTTPDDYDDHTETFMTEHFSRLPVVRARKLKRTKPSHRRRKLRQQPLLPCPDQPT